MSVKYKASGSWSIVATIYTRVSGNWKYVRKISSRVSGTWQQVYSAVWIKGADITSAVYIAAGFGTIYAAVVAGGKNIAGTVITTVYEWADFGWSTGTSLSSARAECDGSGTQTAGFIIGNVQDSETNSCLEYNGTSWSSGGNYIDSISHNPRCCGTQTAGLGTGGYDGKYILSDVGEYNGTSWSTGGSLSTKRCEHGLGGTQSSAVATAGKYQIVGSYISSTEEYNGSSWSSGGAFLNAIGGISGSGSSANNAVMNYTGNFVGYNGTSWSSKTSSPDSCSYRANTTQDGIDVGFFGGRSTSAQADVNIYIGG